MGKANQRREAGARKLWTGVGDYGAPLGNSPWDTPEFEDGLRFAGKDAHATGDARATGGWDAVVGRRSFLQIMGASLAMAGLGGCRPKLAEHIVPYVKAPENGVPGQPLYYATALTLGGYATGVVVRTETGRPIKVEGNPGHPASLGGTDPFVQASILGLYDRDRSQKVLKAGEPQEWSAFVAAAGSEFRRLKTTKGEGLRILTETSTSPTLAQQIKEIEKELPLAKWHCFEPVNRDNAYGGTRLLFGEPADAVYRFDNADVVVSLDSDFLSTGPGHVLYAREFSARRAVRTGAAGINRLYAVENVPTSTGARADHRLSMRAGSVSRFAAALASALGVPAPASGAQDPASVAWIDALREDLLAHRGRCVVVPGEFQPPVVHALAHAMNAALGAIGQTVDFNPPVPFGPLEQGASLHQLVADATAGRVEALLILGGNPVYGAPADVAFASALAKVPFTCHLATHVDETSDKCLWHVPMAHEMESWTDARSFDGTASIIQPLIEPLFGGKTTHEVLAAFVGDERTGLEIVKARWKERAGDGGTGKRDARGHEEFWEKTLSDGVIGGTASPQRHPEVRKGWFAGLPGLDELKITGLEIVFRPDSTVWDGRFSNNAWLQELPKPLAKIVWDNVVVVGPATAKRLGLSQRFGPTGNEELVPLVDLSYGGRTLTRVPVWIQPGQAEESVCVHLGYGRLRAGSVGNGVGFNAFAIRTSASPDFADGAAIRLRGEQYSIATTQLHGTMDGRDVARAADVSEFGRPEEERAEEPISLYPPRKSTGNAWGMVIDTQVCTGCNACVVACQAENNIPTVGKTDVLRGRVMHWLRVDRYYEGDLANPEVHQVPLPCMHCEMAPCEVVCPVAATQHSVEGLNEMVYNRCVGTRYCSNNCPYKVRKFNFRQYVDKLSPLLKLSRNPDVTVRGRGVMEKCTYCVQRINAARKTAKKENRPIRDGEIVTACQAACPAGGIVFGNINDPQSAVSKLRAEPHHYALLSELNTRPRTTYLPRYRNPNPKLLEALKRV